MATLGRLVSSVMVVVINGLEMRGAGVTPGPLLSVAMLPDVGGSKWQANGHTEAMSPSHGLWGGLWNRKCECGDS